MAGFEYPKIETLYDRDPANMKQVLVGVFRRPEFELVDKWLVTEKVDGTNVRVLLNWDFASSDRPELPVVRFGGRTDNAQIPVKLYDALQALFPAEKVAAAFDPGTKAILFGDGYGAGIQKGGIYRPDISFRLFDVVVVTPGFTWWLNWQDVEDVAAKLEIQTVPVLGRNLSTAEAIRLVPNGSQVAFNESGGIGTVDSPRQEGIVARTDPLLLMRNNLRLVWKLKVRDLGLEN